MEKNSLPEESSRNVTTLGKEAFKAILNQLSEDKRQDLVDVFLEVLSNDQQEILQNKLLQKVNRGVRRINNYFHYVIFSFEEFNNYIGDRKFMEECYMIGGNYFGNEGSIQIMWMTDGKIIDFFTHIDMDENCEFHFSSGGERVDLFNQCIGKDPDDRKYIGNICFKFCLEDDLPAGRVGIDCLITGIGEIFGENEDLRRKFNSSSPTECSEFDVVIDGNPRHVLYYVP